MSDKRDLSLTGIIRDEDATNAIKATECLRRLDAPSRSGVPVDDLARAEYRAAAQTFALLAVADAIGQNERVS